MRSLLAHCCLPIAAGPGTARVPLSTRLGRCRAPPALADADSSRRPLRNVSLHSPDSFHHPRWPNWHGARPSRLGRLRCTRPAGLARQPSGDRGALTDWSGPQALEPCRSQRPLSMRRTPAPFDRLLRLGERLLLNHQCQVPETSVLGCTVR